MATSGEGDVVEEERSGVIGEGEVGASRLERTWTSSSSGSSEQRQSRCSSTSRETVDEGVGSDETHKDAFLRLRRQLQEELKRWLYGSM